MSINELKQVAIYVLGCLKTVDIIIIFILALKMNKTDSLNRIKWNVT